MSGLVYRICLPAFKWQLDGMALSKSSENGERNCYIRLLFPVANMECRWKRRRVRRRRLCFALTPHGNPYNKQTCAHKRIHTHWAIWMGNALIFIYRNRIVHICAWHSCKSMMTGVNPSFLFLPVHGSCLFFFFLCFHLSSLAATPCACIYYIWVGLCIA